ncbi:MFS transporter [Amycolatopsis sp. NPDC051373]|uniref:MFS transporter n=1 Tax=Amycolatopsis sp. NPDC051373 TaxID=3155801 RepID=UPI00344EC9FA
MVDDAPGATAPPLFERTPKKAAIAAWIGSALEYYDFFVYASAAALIFPKVFFPQGNATAAVLASLATFGVGYLARPVGSFFMGHLGDRLGRKKVMVASLLLMGTSTFLVGCLPGYGQIGVAAPALLVLLRLLQGVSASGEQAGANSMSFEHAPDHRRAFVTSWTLGGSQAGQVVASAVFIPLAAGLDDAALYSWGWRIPFLVSAVMVVLGFLIRRRLDETPLFTEEVERGDVRRLPVAELFRHHSRQVVRVFFAALIANIGTIFAVFALTFATDDVYGIGMSKTVLLWVTAGGNALAVVTVPLLALVSDRHGRKPMFVGGIAGCAVLTAAFLWSISTADVAMVAVTGVLLLGVAFSATLAVWPATYAEMFPTGVRLSGMAIGTQFGFATAGLTPLITASVAGHSPSGWIPVSIYTCVICLVSAIAVLVGKETYRIPTAQLGARRTTATAVPAER